VTSPLSNPCFLKCVCMCVCCVCVYVLRRRVCVRMPCK
jgi:hypothetical protein